MLTNKKATPGDSTQPSPNRVDRILTDPGDQSSGWFSYSLNHPKNYLGVPAAVAAYDPAEFLIPEYLTSMVKETSDGAEELGLITRQKQLTGIGIEFVAHLEEQFGTPEQALKAFESSTHTRFCDAHPDTAELAQAIFCRQPEIRSLIVTLDRRDDEATTLPTLVTELYNESPGAAKKLFVSSYDPKTDSATSSDGNGTRANPRLSEPSSYNSSTTLQLKSLLYHIGILTTRGSDTTHLDPTEDIWKLSPHLADPVADFARRSVGGEL